MGRHPYKHVRDRMGRKFTDRYGIHFGLGIGLGIGLVFDVGFGKSLSGLYFHCNYYIPQCLHYTVYHLFS